jgi:hypothetical protein
MTVPWYPPELPRPLRDGFKLQRGDGRTVTRPDAGPSIRSRRFSGVAHSVPFSTLLYFSEVARFNRFYDEETKQGTLPFLMPDPIFDGLPLLDGEGSALLTNDGKQILIASTWLCVFGEQLPAYRQLELEWEISFGLVVLP